MFTTASCLYLLAEPRRSSGCHLVCIGIRWLQLWPRDVTVYQGLRFGGTCTIETSSTSKEQLHLSQVMQTLA